MTHELDTIVSTIIALLWRYMLPFTSANNFLNTAVF